MRRFAVALAVVGLVGWLGGPASANHSWSDYHWARTSNPFTLSVIDSVTSKWDTAFVSATTDWSTSSVLDLVTSFGSTTSSARRSCSAATGKIRVCNYTYGRNGWLGIAEIWIDANDHIVKARTKLNDSYMSYAPYNTSAWRNLVTCQEIGHNFGLDHQDENFYNANLGTCMDYTNDPSTNQHPNAHDFEELETIYQHLDGSTTVAQKTSSSPQRSRSPYMRSVREGSVVHVTWVLPADA